MFWRRHNLDQGWCKGFDHLTEKKSHEYYKRHIDNELSFVILRSVDIRHKLED